VAEEELEVERVQPRPPKKGGLFSFGGKMAKKENDQLVKVAEAIVEAIKYGLTHESETRKWLKVKPVKKS